MGASAVLRILLVACVFAAHVSTTAAVLVHLPDRVHAVVKHYDGHSPTVDSVRVHSYESELDASSDLLLAAQWCGRFDFRVVVDHCDCRIPRAHRTPHTRRMYADYSMRVYANDGYEHFSAEAKGQPRDAAEPSAASASGLPWTHLSDGRRQYGPVWMNAWPVDGQPLMNVVPIDAFKEWAQQEAESVEHRLHFWNRSQPVKPSRSGSGRPDIQVKLQYAGGESVVSFSHNECLNLSRPLWSDDASEIPFGLSVARGGCVLVFDDDRCSGPAPWTVVQQPAILYAMGDGSGRKRPPTAVAALKKSRSVTGCCRRELDLKPLWKPDMPMPERSIGRSECSCGANGSHIGMAGELSRKYSKEQPRAGQSEAPDEQELGRLFELNEIASDAMGKARKAALSVATQATMAGRNASVAAATAALGTVVKTGKWSLAVLATAPWVEPQAVSLLTEAVQITDRAVRLAKEATPETAATMVVYATQTTMCVPAFIAWSYHDVAATVDRNRATGPDVETARQLMRGRRAAIETSKSGAENGVKNGAGKGDGTWTKLAETTVPRGEKAYDEHEAEVILMDRKVFEHLSQQHFDRTLHLTLVIYALCTVCIYYIFEYMRRWMRNLWAPRVLALVCYGSAKPTQNDVSA